MNTNNNTTFTNEVSVDYHIGKIALFKALLNPTLKCIRKEGSREWIDNKQDVLTELKSVSKGVDMINEQIVALQKELQEYQLSINNTINELENQ
jgi:conjugal transfer/entry exclusion protein